MHDGLKTMPSSRPIHLLVLTSIAAAALGCGGSGPSGPLLGEVAGVVTYKGQPLAQASVTFFPTEPGARPAVGVTDGSGRYRLATSGQQSGALTGPCQVAILLRAPYDGPVPDGMSPAYAKEQFQNLGKPLIPEKYFSAQTSGLTADVKPGRNVHDFQLLD